MARPKSPETLGAYGFRLPAAVVERVDAYAKQLEQYLPGARTSRSIAIRVLLEKALTAEGFPAQPQPKGKSRK